MRYLLKQGTIIPSLPMALFVYNIVSAAFAGLAPIIFSHPVSWSWQFWDQPEGHKYLVKCELPLNVLC